MKQFQYVSGRTGTVFGPYTEAEVQAMTPLVHDALTLDPGQTWTDYEADVWSRADGGASPNERLERIALEYVRILLPAHINGLHLDGMVSEAAVRGAKALIAELDKQA